MRVIGTAGHVDHGKSTLVKALTGIDPDRLKEEKKRQMTIDLGFAWYESQAQGDIGIVDVPGHRDFIENMLAGIGGIDAVLLVIAADEGVMPQTSEHLAIIDLLHINTGLIVLTKIDLIDDPDWLDLVEMEVSEKVVGTCLEKAPLLRVSAMTGEGMPELRKTIDELLAPLSPRPDFGRPRLPIDRVFSLTGFGTIVTGTLLDGSFKLDHEVEILPSHRMARIRGLQTHKKTEKTAFPGSRTAINLSGIDASEIDRGEVVALPGMFKPTQRIDARLELLKDAPTALKHNDFVKLFVLTSESTGRVRLLQGQELKPGDSGWAQIEFEREIVLEKKDRFILRRMSPAQTLGGGEVVDAHPTARYKLNDSGIIERLELKTAPALENTILAFIMETPFTSIQEIKERLKITPESLHENLDGLIVNGKVLVFEGIDSAGKRYVPWGFWQGLSARVFEILNQYHQQFPLRNGISSEELARRLRISTGNMLISLNQWIDEKVVEQIDEVISLPGFIIRYSANQTRRLEKYYALIDQQAFIPPGVKESKEMLTDELYQSLVDRGLLIQVSSEVVLREKEYRLMLDYVQNECGKGVLLTLAQFRDHFNTNRKVSQSFLEHLDRNGVTQREGEGRRLKKKT